MWRITDDDLESSKRISVKPGRNDDLSFALDFMLAVGMRDSFK